ncbi:MAG: hypothetical protein P4L51_05530 [Puia sp.]|nr:hypothetical protein [Puia sp.]
MARKSNFRRVWGIPLSISCSILFGLLSALLGAGVWHFLSWISLSIPLVIIAWKLRHLAHTGAKRRTIQ